MTNSPQEIRREIDRLAQAGYDQFDPGGWRTEQLRAACDRWLAAWELVKQLITPEIRTPDDFDAAYPSRKLPLVNWLTDLEMHLHNVGLDEARYLEERIRFVHEQLTYFPDIDGDACVALRRAEGEALWLLGRQSEAEAVYQALVDKLPDHAWAYISWADQYTWGIGGRPTDYPRAEAILFQALERPDLDDLASVLDRLFDLYKAWDKPEKAQALAEEYKAILVAKEERLLAEKAHLEKELSVLKKAKQSQAKQTAAPGRNDPCWRGSGKKYKKCHWQSDRLA